MKNKIEESFLDAISELDAATNSKGELTVLAANAVNAKDDISNRQFIKRFMTIVNDASAYPSDALNVIKHARGVLYSYYGYIKVKDLFIESAERQDAYADKSLDELLDELDSLIGLHSVKEKINALINYQRVQQMRKQHGLTSDARSLHLAFVGNPGTGKTTVARIVGHVYKKLGLLSKGHFMEVSRTDLIAGYQGQTALKVKKVIEQAKGGVLFIDEAYSITENENSDSYGRECLTELTKALEDYRDDLVVIVAGYVEPMRKFFESNPGLKSRFNTFVDFPDYEQDELLAILKVLCKKNDYKISESLEHKIVEYIAYKKNQPDLFSNGRMIRNLFETLTIKQAGRLCKLDMPSAEDLILLDDVDFDMHD